jgi:hypothetical protein
MAYNDFPGGYGTSARFGMFRRGTVGQSATTLQQITTARVGQIVWIGYTIGASFSMSNGTATINDFPSDFVVSEWLKSPTVLTLPQTSQTWSASPPTVDLGDVITLGNPANVDGDATYYVLFEGTFTGAGTKSFEVEFDATNATGPTAIPFTINVVPPNNPNFGLPLECQTGPVGWYPDYTTGKLVFNDMDDYTIPNYAVRFNGSGPFELHVATLEGDDVTVVNGTVAYPRVERKRVAKITCQMLFGAQPDGTPHNSAQEGLVLNWAEFTALSDPTVSDTQGVQSVTYTPYPGATPVTFAAHVLPPVVGDVQNGIGMNFGFEMQVPDPSNLP